MTTPRIEEILSNIEKRLEAKFNLIVRALIQNINGTITEGERMDICNKLNQDGINEIRQALTQAHQAGIDEAVLDKEIDLTTAALMGMLTAGFPEELGNKHASLIAKSIMKNPTVEREALQDNK